MPANKTITYAELRVGSLVAVSLMVAMAATVYITREGGLPFLGDQYTVYSYLRDVNGLKTGSPVHLSGVEVGSVRDVAFAGPDEPAPVRVAMGLRIDVQDRITTNALVTVGSLGVLGERMLDVDPGPPGGIPIEDHGFVPGEAVGDPIKGIISDASTTMKDVRDLAAELQQGEGTLGAFLKREDFHDKLLAMVGKVESVFVALDRREGTFGKLIHDPVMFDDLTELLLVMGDLMDRIDKGDGTISRLVNDPEIGRTLAHTTENLAHLTQRLDEGEGTLGALLRERELYDRLDSLAANMNSIAGRLDRGDGTAGQLIHNRDLYENLNKTVNELQGLIGDIRKDPKDYLRIKVSLF